MQKGEEERTHPLRSKWSFTCPTYAKLVKKLTNKAGDALRGDESFTSQPQRSEKAERDLTGVSSVIMHTGVKRRSIRSKKYHSEQTREEI